MTSLPRRQFLGSSVLAGSAVAAGALSSSTSLAHEDATGGRQYYEWRSYKLDNAAQQKRVLGFLESAAVPAWDRSGMGSAGVFTETGAEATSSVHVLLTFSSAEQMLSERAGLEADGQYMQAAASYLGSAQDDPAFKQIDSSLLVAFAGQPQLDVPKKRPRVLELRTYHSHSEAKARRKIEMFNNGEIPIFRKAGFETVFFGESLIGPGLPNLKYMLAADDMAANEASWKKFVEHPDWVAMKDLPKYAETVSQIEKLFLVPTAFSGI